MPNYAEIYEKINLKHQQKEAEAAKALHEKTLEMENRRYRRREEVRGTITTICAILALLLSILALIWQIPLH